MHPHRSQVHKSQASKCKQMVDPLKSAVDEGLPMDEYGASTPIIGKKFGSLGPNQPSHMSGSTSRLLNRAPKQFGP